MASHNLSKFMPWHSSSQAIESILGADDEARRATLEAKWKASKLSELTSVCITVSCEPVRPSLEMSLADHFSPKGALIAGVITNSILWDSVKEGSWTLLGIWYASLIISLTCVTSATQQAIALYRVSSVDLLPLIGSYPGERGGFVAIYVWQVPVMLLNVSILLFVVGVLILVWEQATRDLALNHDLKVCRYIIHSLMFGLTSVPWI